tara:strand:- start:84 stop:1019 length:936 start_codon:yes stop_codon:yes gene_type:complete
MVNFKSALITGANGNLGRLLAQKLSKAGIDVICFDLAETELNDKSNFKKIFLGDIRDQDLLKNIIEDHCPQAVFHLASLLSGSSEKDLDQAWHVNATSSINLMKVANANKVSMFFFASTIATYGSNTNNPLPEDYPQWPENFYGVTKLAVERFGIYLKQNYGFDFRCLRFPMVLSPFAPLSAKTAYPSHAIRAAKNREIFHFPVAKKTGMSCMFIDDVISSILGITFSKHKLIKKHVYNLHGFHFTAQELGDRLKQLFPSFKYSFDADPQIDNLIKGWPNVVVSSSAKSDWNWSPKFDFEKSIKAMIESIK